MSEGSQAFDTDLDQAASIVAAYVSNNSLRAADLPDLIATVHAALRQITHGPSQDATPPASVPAVPIKKSVAKDYIICLEDGKKFKSLRRHLSTYHNLTPDQYRAKWGLPSDHPMVAPSYSAKRSQLAKDSGLGLVSKEPGDEPAPRPAKAAGGADAPKKPGRGRPRRTAAA